MSIAAQVAILFLVVLGGVRSRRLGYITDETLLTPDFRSQALILRLPCPSEHQREEYLESQLEWQVDNPESPMVALQAALTLENIAVSELAGFYEGLYLCFVKASVCLVVFGNQHKTSRELVAFGESER